MGFSQIQIKSNKDLKIMKIISNALNTNMVTIITFLRTLGCRFCVRMWYLASSSFISLVSLSFVSLYCVHFVRPLNILKQDQTLTL